jgi:hypothetical protein
MDAQAFINQTAAGNAVGAKDLLNDLLSARAFEALDAKKIEMAQAIFTGEEPVEAEDQSTKETEQEE